MPRKDPVSDRDLTQQINQYLLSRGVRSPCSVSVNVQKGIVTLSGRIQYEHQRQVVLQAARGVDGVGRVVDQLMVVPQGGKGW